MELCDCKLDDNFLSNVLHIWEESVLNFITKNYEKFKFESTWSKFLALFKHFSWIRGLGASIADFGSGDRGSIPRKTWHFSKSIFKVRLLFLPCGELLLPAIFKMGSTFFVSSQKLKKTHLTENRGKKWKIVWYRIWTSDLSVSSPTLCHWAMRTHYYNHENLKKY